jgi:GntR family histidine utilization transcriptional repressor
MRQRAMTINQNMPLHQRMRSDIAGRILSGEWPPGHRIPFEYELMSEFKCSRATVSKVLADLASNGMIQRRRRVGSFVAHPQSRSVVVEIADVKKEVAALGLPYRFDILARALGCSEQIDGALRGACENDPMLWINCCHYAGHQPFCLEERLINLRAVPEALQEEFKDSSPGAWLMSRVPWTAAEHRIMSAGASATAAAILKVRTGAACLVVDRRTWIAERTITFVRLTYPGNLHGLTARFAPPRPVGAPHAVSTLDASRRGEG